MHSDQRGSRKAIADLQALLALFPDDLTARWLLNLAFMTVGEYPSRVTEKVLIPPSVFASEEDFPRFTDIAPALGLNSRDLSGGACVDDFDGDLDYDIVTSTWDTRGAMHYYRSNGDGTFTDRTEEAGLAELLGGINLVQGDYDNDGDLDLFVMRGAWLEGGGCHPNSLLQNDGHGTFVDVTYDAGLARVDYPTHSAAFADYDLDGDLDLYVGNEAREALPYPCELFQNDGHGKFTDVAAAAGVVNLRYAKGVTWGDYDGDRYPDLYVSNLRGENRLYRNSGDGTFADVAPKLGVTRPILSFPAWFWDFDNDGALDLFVSSWENDVGLFVASLLGLPHQGELACLYRGDGRGGFTEVAREQNLHRISEPMGANFGDLDNDGYLDFYLGTGYPAYEALMPNVMYRNRRGKGFADVTTAGGFGHLQKGHGVSFADLDNDGDQDVFEQMGGAYPGDGFGDVLYENPGFPHHWIKIQLVGVTSNRCAMGSRIRIVVRENGVERSIYRHVNSGGTFGSNPLRQELGLGQAEKIVQLEIYWPASDRTQAFRDVPMDCLLRIQEDQELYERLPLERFELAR